MIVCIDTKSAEVTMDKKYKTRLIDMTGQKIGKLTVLKYLGTKGKGALWLCKCDCGNECKKYGGQLRKMLGVSCGCDTRQKQIDIAHRTIAKTKHGDCFSRLYFVWLDMRARCNNPKDISYHNYGAKGVTVCNEWMHDYLNFKKWALKNGYNPDAKRGECTLDRIDNSKGYGPNNCRWVNARVQSNNRKNSYRIEYNGEIHTASEWSEITGIPQGVIYARRKAGWGPEKILSRAKYNPHHEIIGSY